ncbi:putative E3 ubiquitin-protein ligase [Toxoplasma gondii CAST]|uniref:Putative E3 ubiquitin-protein ligase n=1 Tax=Toxoplasma gondii CAST TaxID=943122 RepID=A0A425HRZ0_TOXGO|nr:putative E3 ubiquitin-protein ligase [Toxoplasma gondii CAST]
MNPSDHTESPGPGGRPGGSQLNWGLFEQFLLIDLKPTEAAISALTLDAKLRSSSAWAALSAEGRSLSVDQIFSLASATGSEEERATFSHLSAAFRVCPAFRKLQEARQFVLTESQFTDPDLPKGNREKWKPIVEFFGNLYALSASFLLPSPCSSSSSSSSPSCCSPDAFSKRENDRDLSSPSLSRESSSVSASSVSNNPASAAVSPREHGILAGRRISAVERLREKTDVNLHKLTDFYSTIQKAARASANEGYDPLPEILEKIRDFCDKLQSNVDSFFYPSQLRFVLVLLECPFYEEDGNLISLVELVRTVSMLQDEAKQILVNWYATLPIF